MFCKPTLLAALLLPIALGACMAEDKHIDEPSVEIPRFDPSHGQPSSEFSRVSCQSNLFSSPDFSLLDQYSTIDSAITIPSFILSPYQDAKVSFEIRLEGSEVKTVALSFGEQFCWLRGNKTSFDYQESSSTLYYDFETMAVEPGAWYPIESKAPLSYLASSSFIGSGFQIRLLERGEFHLRNLTVTHGSDETQTVLIP